MSTEWDKGLRSWAEVTRIWNAQENLNDRVDAVKETGLRALRKLRELMEEEGKEFEDFK